MAMGQMGKNPLCHMNSSAILWWFMDAHPLSIPRYGGWLRNPAPVENGGKHPII